MNPPALVTGAPGWLGSRLVQLLVTGLADVPALASPAPRRIRCLVLAGTPAAALAALPPAVELVEGDVRDPRSLVPFVRAAAGATLFHLGGVVTTRRLQDYDDVNVEGTRHVLHAAVGAGVARVIGISSDTVVGWNHRSDGVFDESAPPRPHLAYGRSKHRMEELLREAFAAGRLETVVVRPCRFYGPGQPLARTRLYRLMRQGRLPIFGGGRNLCSLSYLDNVCQVLLLAERTARAAGGTYWVADRRPYPMIEIVATVRRLAGELGLPVNGRGLHLPGAVARGAARIERLLDRLGLRDERLHAVAHLGSTIVCSSAKAERELGYEPTVELEEGLRRALCWSRDHGQPL